jgi:hypothetical protein
VPPIITAVVTMSMHIVRTEVWNAGPNPFHLEFSYIMNQLPPMTVIYAHAWSQVASMKRDANPLSAGTPSPLSTPPINGQLLTAGFVGSVMLSKSTRR